MLSRKRRKSSSAAGAEFNAMFMILHDKGTKSKIGWSFFVRQLGGRGGGKVTYRTAPHLGVLFAHRCDQGGLNYLCMLNLSTGEVRKSEAE